MNIVIKDVLLNENRTNVIIKSGKIDSIDAEPFSKKDEYDIEIDGNNKAIFPFLHNGHTHSPMVLLRGYGDDMLLDAWLKERIWPIEARLTDEDYYWGNRLALVEMIKSGTGFFNEMYMNPRSLLDALKDLPIKSIVNFPIIDGMNEDVAKNQIVDCLDFFEKSDFPSNIQPGLALHSVYANSSYSLKWVSDYARKNKIPIHIHLSETKKEVDDCRNDHEGLSPIEYLEKLNFFTDNQVYGAHCVWLDEKDMSIMSDHKVTAVHNPVSNMKLASANALPFKELKESNIPVVLGTDGAASNNNLDMLEEAKIAALLQKHHFGDPTRLSAKEALSMVTSEAARTFHTGSGEIKVGENADFMLIRIDSPSMVPVTDLTSNLIYSANGSEVTDLICNGQPLMINREIKGEKEIKENAIKCALRLTGGSDD